MLFLVIADGHMGGIVQQHIGGLQHGIGEQRDAGAFAVLAGLVLELRHPVQPAHARGAVQQPLQLGMGGHTGLVEQGRLVRIDARCDQRGGHFARTGAQGRRIMRHGYGVQIGQEEQAFAFILHLHPVDDRAEIIAEMEIAGGLDAGDDAHDQVVSSGVVLAGARRTSARMSPSRKARVRKQAPR